jgi:hypothetical protein
VLLAALALGAAACDRDPSAPPAESLQFAEIVLADAAGQAVAYSHADHWHGFVRVRRGEQQVLRAYFAAQPVGDSHEAPTVRFTLESHPDYLLRTTTVDPTVASWEGDRFVLTVRGGTPGSTGTSFVVRRGSTTVFQAPPTSVVVAE